MDKMKRFRRLRRRIVLAAVLCIVYVLSAASPEVRLRKLSLPDGHNAQLRWQYVGLRAEDLLQRASEAPQRLRECALRVEELIGSMKK